MGRLSRLLHPTSLHQWLEKRKQEHIVRKLYKQDRKRFLDHSFALDSVRTPRKTLEARIAFHYHALEKGLSHLDFREGFGKTALNGLVEAMHAYKKDCDPSLSVRYETGLSVLEAYVRKHKARDVDVPWVEAVLNTLKADFKKDPEDIGGVYHFTRDQILKHTDPNFEAMAMHRYSVRDFGDESIPMETIEIAVKTAMKSPSVSNRQGWHVHVMRDQSLIKDVLKVQGGLNGHGRNISALLLITSDYTALGDAGEYKQGHIDGGLFSMSLLHAFTSKGVATCPLNSDLHPEGEEEIRRILDLDDEEGLVMFMAVGSYPEEMKIPKSKRDHASDHLIKHE